MNWSERIAAWLGVEKKAGLPRAEEWLGLAGWNTAFGESDRDARSMVEQGYKKNSAVFACVSALAFAFPEPPLVVFAKDRPGERIDRHPIRLLLHKPNPHMGEAELLQYVIAYMAIGGNAYLYKHRDYSGQVVELWPYHAGEMWPESSSVNWIDHFVYDRGDGTYAKIAPEDVIHCKWMPDPQAPNLGLAPLKAVAREIDSDNELSNYLIALLKNDAMPRTALRLPETAHLSEEQYRRLREQFVARHGGPKRGNVAVLEGGVDVQRLALGLDEMAFDSLRGVPEARIAAAFRVPPIVAGLNIGLARSTYSNYHEARRSFAEQTLVPLWRSVAAEIERALAADFGADDVDVRFDLRQVEALGESTGERWQRILDGVQRGVLQLNEARAQLGYDPLPDGDRFV